MLSKEDVLKNFLKEDTEDVIKVYQCMSLAYNKGIPTFTKFFCKPNIWISNDGRYYLRSSRKRCVCRSQLLDWRG